MYRFFKLEKFYIFIFFSIKPLYTHANIYEAIHNLLITSQALVYISQLDVSSITSSKTISSRTNLFK